MSVDTTRITALANKWRRQITNRELLEIIDAAIELTKPIKFGDWQPCIGDGCPACAERRAARTASQRKWRAGSKNTVPDPR